MKKWMKRLGIFLCVLIIVFIAAYGLFRYRVTFDAPQVPTSSFELQERIEHDSNYYSLGNNWLMRDTSTGVWFTYFEGDAYDRGIVYGKLCKDLMYEQEVYFVNEIKRQIPSPYYLNFLKYFIAWFNRDMDKHVPLEYQQEIYGESKVCSSEFDFVGPGYQRMLNYHAAHDIGHALQNMNLVGCTAYAVWGKKANGKLLVGRNFDFYAGEDFAKQKLISMVNPSKGYKYVSISWGGLLGVVSGMNNQGLTVTLNAAKSGIPSGAATPVSIIAREVIQYASNISEAYAIIKKRQAFISESFLVSSANDSIVVVIEKTPDTTAMYEVPQEQGRLILTNHFQCSSLFNSELNKSYRAQGTSEYRYKRVAELLDSLTTYNIENMALVARDTKGLKGKNIGLGNEKAINQLLAHHSVLFSPYDHEAWFSTRPYQLGKYISIQLDTLFKYAPGCSQLSKVLTTHTIAPSDFLTSSTYKQFESYKRMAWKLDSIQRGKSNIRYTQAQINSFVQNNASYFYTYKLVGDYYANTMNDKTKALAYYETALTKEISSEAERLSILERIQKIKSK